MENKQEAISYISNILIENVKGANPLNPVLPERKYPTDAQRESSRKNAAKARAKLAELRDKGKMKKAEPFSDSAFAGNCYFLITVDI